MALHEEEEGVVVVVGYGDVEAEAEVVAPGDAVVLGADVGDGFWGQ